MIISTTVTDDVKLDDINNAVLKQIIFENLQELKESIQGEIDRLHVIDTGETRRRVDVDVKYNGDEVIGNVSVNTPYAIYQEYGTYLNGYKTGNAQGEITYTMQPGGISARPFFRNTLNNELEPMLTNIKQQIKKEVTKE